MRHLSIHRPRMNSQFWSNNVSMAGVNTHPNEVGPSRFNVEVQEVENDTVREITKAAVIDDKSLSSIDHLLTGKYLIPMEARYDKP